MISSKSKGLAGLKARQLKLRLIVKILSDLHRANYRYLVAIGSET